MRRQLHCRRVSAPPGRRLPERSPADFFAACCGTLSAAATAGRCLAFAAFDSRRRLCSQLLPGLRGRMRSACRRETAEQNHQHGPPTPRLPIDPTAVRAAAGSSAVVGSQRMRHFRSQRGSPACRDQSHDDAAQQQIDAGRHELASLEIVGPQLKIQLRESTAGSAGRSGSLSTRSFSARYCGVSNSSYLPRPTKSMVSNRQTISEKTPGHDRRPQYSRISDLQLHAGVSSTISDTSWIKPSRTNSTGQDLKQRPHDTHPD